MKGGRYPTAYQVARALCAAAILTGETELLEHDARGVLEGKLQFRARFYAAAVLQALYLDADPRVIGRLCGCFSSANFVRRRALWWQHASEAVLFKIMAD